MDNAEDILNLISGGESEKIEFKKSTASLREAIDTVCAFANHKGGHLIFGVKDNGTITGQQVSDDTLKNIANAVKLNTDPKLYPGIEKIDMDGKTCVLVSVSESPLKPHLSHGRAFIRVGATNQRIDRDRYEHLLEQRHNGYGFDFQVQPKASIGDIDPDAVYKFLETANSVRNLNENTLLPVEIILQKLELLKDEGITNAALLLFGKEPHKFFHTYYETKCGHFPVAEGYGEISNDKEYAYNIIENFNLSLAFIKDSIRMSATKNGVLRTEEWELPISVLREALVNMIVHRDYRQNIKNTIEIRPSFISFYNPAHLFRPAITIENLKKNHPSRPGNRLIAKIFYMMGVFENWGGGTLQIIADTLKAGKPSPGFFYEDGMFRLELYRK